MADTEKAKPVQGEAIWPHPDDQVPHPVPWPVGQPSGVTNEHPTFPIELK